MYVASFWANQKSMWLNWAQLKCDGKSAFGYDVFILFSVVQSNIASSSIFAWLSSELLLRSNVHLSGSLTTSMWGLSQSDLIFWQAFCIGSKDTKASHTTTHNKDTLATVSKCTTQAYSYFKEPYGHIIHHVASWGIMAASISSLAKTCLVNHASWISRFNVSNRNAQLSVVPATTTMLEKQNIHE